MSTKDNYLHAMKVQLEELRAAIDKLEGKTHIAEVTVMTAYQSEMRAMRLQMQRAQVKLDEIREAGEATWEHMKAEMEKAFNALADLLRDFKARD